MGWSLVARIDRVRESQFEDANEAYIGAHGESTETAPLRFFWRMHDASEDRGYHVETDSKLIELGVFIPASLSIANCLFFRTRSRFSVGSLPSFKSRSQASAHSAYFPIQ